MNPVPDVVAQAMRRAAALEFQASCEEPVGPLLATLAAAVPPGGRILELGQYDLVFADAVAGKWTGLYLTLGALAPGGMLVLDDMDLRRYADPAHQAAVTRVHETVATDVRLTRVRLDTGSGVILAVRRHPDSGDS